MYRIDIKNKTWEEARYKTQLTLEEKYISGATRLSRYQLKQFKYLSRLIQHLGAGNAANIQQSETQRIAMYTVHFYTFRT